MLYYVLGTMGAGKTLFATLFCIEYQKLNPDNKIYANYKLELNNFIYSPNMFLPFSEIENCLIVADDFYALTTVKGFIQIISNMSRKKNLTIILTAQYYTMIPKIIRKLSDFEVRTGYNEFDDILHCYLITADDNLTEYKVDNAVKLAKDYYNTNEIVNFPTESKLLKEIKEFSKTIDDLELNLSLFTSNSQKRNRLFKQMKKELFNE